MYKGTQQGMFSPKQHATIHQKKKKKLSRAYFLIYINDAFE
jgi:hypothetical protein